MHWHVLKPPQVVGETVLLVTMGSSVATGNSEGSQTNIHTNFTINGLVKSICQCPCCIIAVLSVVQLLKVKWWYTKMTLLFSKILCTSLEQKSELINSSRDFI